MEFEDSLKKSLAVAMQRTESEMSNIKLTINDIYSEFQNKKLIDITEAIRQGTFGKYGTCYKLTTQVIGYWINQFFKEKNNNNLRL